MLLDDGPQGGVVRAERGDDLPGAIQTLEELKLVRGERVDRRRRRRARRLSGRHPGPAAESGQCRDPYPRVTTAVDCTLTITSLDDGVIVAAYASNMLTAAANNLAYATGTLRLPRPTCAAA